MMRARRQLLRLMVLRESSFGLCATCCFGRTVGNKHGSKFVLCERSQSDPNYPKYPRTPVVQCRGYEAAPSRDRGEAGSSDLAALHEIGGDDGGPVDPADADRGEGDA